MTEKYFNHSDFRRNNLGKSSSPYLLQHKDNPVWWPEWKENMNMFAAYVESFREGNKWIESGAEDFRTIMASWNDQPVPSGTSLAETGLTRYSLLTGQDVKPLKYSRVLQSDFYNINVLLRNERFHVYTSKLPLSWKDIPANSIQKRGEPETDCYNKICRML